MSRKKLYEVQLSEAERSTLLELLVGGTEKVRKLTRARILLKADDGWTDRQIAEGLNVGRATSERIRKRYAQQGLAVALNDKRRHRVYERKIDGATEARLIALTTGQAPAGYSRWTIRLLAAELVKLEAVSFDTISYESIRKVLKKTNLNLGETKSG